MRRQMAVFTLAFVALMLLVLPGYAYADGGTALSSASQMAFEILVPVISIFAVWGAHRLIKLLEAKLGYDLPEKQERKVDDWIEEGIHWAEEKSRKKIKEKTDKLSGPDKLEIAADFVLSFVESRKWDAWTRDQLKAKIEAKLGLHRINGEKPSLDKDDA